MPPRELTPEIELSVPRPFGNDKPTPIPFPPAPLHPRPLTPPIPPNLPAHSESPSPSPSLVPPERPSVKIEEVEDNQDNNTEMLSPSPLPPKAGPSHLQPGEDATSQRYDLRRSTHETRIPHREGNIYGEDHHPTDILRCSEWQQHLGEANPDMACRMPENAHRHTQVQPDTVPIAGVYCPFN